MKLIHAAVLIGATGAFQLSPSFQQKSQHLATSNCQSRHNRSRISPFSPHRPSSQSPTSLSGKLWKRLQIEEDPPEQGTSWYLINCVAGVELDLLNQARHVTRDFPAADVEKIVVPTQRHLRSHGDKKKVVDVKVRYPGYVFCKIRLTEDVYEVLQELELARSWMGTVNRKGHKKLPPAPVPLNDEEVKRFRGLEEEQELFDDMFGGDYSGRNDKGEDLLAQYAGYEVGQMVKVLRGNFEGEDGTVRRLKDGQICVRMFTYGQTFDNWFDPDAIRPLTDLEVMRGLGGPTKPINQDQFDVSIGKKDPTILLDADSREGRSGLLQSAGIGDSGRNRRQDRVARGETGRDMFGRTAEEMKREEANWLAYREEKRAASQRAPVVQKVVKDGPKKGQDTWGAIERSSWDGGEYGFEADSEAEERARIRRTQEMYQDRQDFRAYDRNQRRGINTREDSRGPRSSAYDVRGERNQRYESRDSLRSAFGDGQRDGGFRERRPVRDSRDGPRNDKFGRTKRVKEEDWASQSQAVSNTEADDFFSSLMKELKDDVDSSTTRERGTRHHDNAGPNVRAPKSNSEDSFFENLMSELGDALEAERSTDTDTGRDSDSDDDFFASLESELSDSLNGGSTPNRPNTNRDDDDDDAFFASLESELSSSLDGNKGRRETIMRSDPDDDFFASLQEEIDGSLGKEESDGATFENDFFSGLMDDVADELEMTQKKSTVKVERSPKSTHADYDSMTVPELKDILKSRGLKIGGRKAELIERLQSS